MISVLIDGIDRSDIIDFGSLKKKDAINQTADTGSLSIVYNAGQTFRPAANSEIEIYSDTEKIFGGRISRVTRQITNPGEVKYIVNFKDYSYDFGRVLINEGYDNETVDDIIDDIVATINAETGLTFTTNNVNCTILITKIRFARVPGDECLDRLADLTGYSFYIDYDNDIHFFERNTEAAPFNLVETDGNYIPDTLEITDDLTQIRNRVYIKGAEIEGESRSENYQGDGDKLYFKLSNKFARKPTVEVDSVDQNVGVDFLDNEADFDCFWDFNQQYIRFKAAPGAVNVEITGIPLYTPEFMVDDPTSIAQYGVFEFAETNKSLESREQAVSYAGTKLTAYQNGVIEGQFETYRPGLRSGQIITVTNTLLGVNESFLIQSVGFRMVTNETHLYQVTLATLRTIGMIEFLMGLIRSEQKILERDSEVVIEKYIRPRETITIEDEVAINTDDYPQAETVQVSDQTFVQALNFDVEFVAGPYIPDPSDPDDKKRVFILDGSKLG